MKLQLFRPGKDTPPQSHPLFADLASCGFPRPAGGYVQSALDGYCKRLSTTSEVVDISWPGH